MKMNKIFLWVPVSVLSMLGNQCNLGSNDKLGQRYIVNYSMIADRTLNERDETKRGILGLGIEEARRGERQFLRRGERRFPLYVDEVAGLTPQFINEGQVVGYSCTRPLESEIGLEVQKIISILSQVKSEKSNIVLIGHPGIDTDLRVYALAERLFPKDEKGMPRCSGVPDNMVNQDIITVDFKLLSEELSGLNSEEYIDFISQNILNAFGNNDIFYLRKIDTFLANKSIKINDLLNLFINHNAKVIIDSSAGNYTNYFDTSAIRAKVFEINLRDLTVAELESYLNKVAQVESIKEGISIPYGTVRKIARLTRAFLPGMDLRRNEGALEVSVAILSRLIDEIKLENGSMNEEDGDKFVYEQINYNLSKDKRTLIATSEANDEQAYSDSAIDFYVDNESMYFVNAKAREYFALKVKEILLEEFERLNKEMDDLKTQLTGVRIDILDQIKTSTNQVRVRIANLGRKVDRSEQNVIRQTIESSEAIVNQLSKKLDSVQLKMLNKLADVQDTLMLRVAEAEGEITSQEEATRALMLGVQSTLAAAIGNLDTKVDAAKSEMLEQLVKAQTQIATDFSKALAEKANQSERQDLLLRIAAQQNAIDQLSVSDILILLNHCPDNYTQAEIEKIKVHESEKQFANQLVVLRKGDVVAECNDISSTNNYCLVIRGDRVNEYFPKKHFPEGVKLNQPSAISGTTTTTNKWFSRTCTPKWIFK